MEEFGLFDNFEAVKYIFKNEYILVEELKYVQKQIYMIRTALQKHKHWISTLFGVRHDCCAEPFSAPLADDMHSGRLSLKIQLSQLAKMFNSDRLTEEFLKKSFLQTASPKSIMDHAGGENSYN